jgi:hypothetical protein
LIQPDDFPAPATTSHREQNSFAWMLSYSPVLAASSGLLWRDILARYSAIQRFGGENLGGK